MKNQTFQFLKPPKLRDGDLTLALTGKHPANPERGFVPSYEFEMRETATRQKMGSIRLRIGSARELRCPSHIGYQVDPDFRGNHYAARSVRLLLPFAAARGIKVGGSSLR
jgi:tagatose 1,6-diphosphate aldolase